MIIEKTDEIKPNTAAYIKNGRWTHYFLKDSATGSLLGVIPAPSGLDIHVIPKGATYNDLHENDSISIFKDSIELSHLPDKVSYLPDNFNVNYMSQIKIFKPNELYTDGESIFITNDNPIKIVANPESFKQCPVKVINDITNEKSIRMADKLQPMISTSMCNTMFELATNGTPIDKIYMRTGAKYNTLIRTAVNAGALIHTLNLKSNEEFIKLLKETLKHEDKNTSHLFELLDDNSHLIIYGSLDRNKSKHIYTISDLKKVIASIWYDNYNSNYKKEYQNEKIWDLITVLSYISNHEIWNIKS